LPNPQRFYREVRSLDDAKTAIHELTDHTYDLREQVAGHERTIADLHGKLKAQAGASAAKQAFTGDIQGIKVKAVTDPLSLKNGWTLKYNAATGELEFAP
jgi:hypothetical protein